MPCILFRLYRHLDQVGVALGSSRFFQKQSKTHGSHSQYLIGRPGYTPLSENLCTIIFLDFQELTFHQRNVNTMHTYKVNSPCISQTHVYMQISHHYNFLLTYIQKCNTSHTFAMRKDNSSKSAQHAVSTQQITSIIIRGSLQST